MLPRPLFVGECPGGMADDSAKRYSPLFPYPHGSAGYHLYELTGLRNRALYLNHSDRVNLIPVPMACWPVRDARRAAQNLEHGGLLRDRLVILCGARVQAAFGLKDQLAPFMVSRGQAGDMAIMPHPSGRCRLWGNPAIVAACREFMRRRVFPDLPDKAFRP